jgi:hypothetical protein
MITDLREERESLWRLVAPPTLWALHLLLSYCTAAIYCEKTAAPEGPLGPVRIAIAVYTALALTGIAYYGVRGQRAHRHGGAALPHDDDSPEDRHRFLGFATALLAGISAIAVMWQALPAVFIGSCR